MNLIIYVCNCLFGLFTALTCIIVFAKINFVELKPLEAIRNEVEQANRVRSSVGEFQGAQRGYNQLSTSEGRERQRESAAVSYGGVMHMARNSSAPSFKGSQAEANLPKDDQPLENLTSKNSTVQEAELLEDGLSSAKLRHALLSLQNPRLLGGDILVSASHLNQPGGGGGGQRRRLIKFARSALVDRVSLWPNGVIFYELDESALHLHQLIRRVVEQFHEQTCIRFVARRNNEPDYLRIGALNGCFSFIGRIGGEQILSLGNGCEYRGTIAHELLHAVGFYHHQNRSDRDEFLEILWDNIARGKESQFSKMAPEENILLGEFDYNSIMLYGPHTFGRTFDRHTMKPKRDGVILLEVVKKPGLSQLDIRSVNKLYNCSDSI